MRLLRIAALMGAIVGGALSASGGAAASPFAAGAIPAAQAETPFVTKVWHQGRPHYGPPRRYGPRRYYGQRSYRPYRPAYGPGYGYRPRPRIVCRVRYQTVRTAYGRLIRRPVEVCRRRW
jgi:hypothetical protein